MELSQKTQQELEEKKRQRIQEYVKRINTIVIKVTDLFKQEQLNMGECIDVVNQTTKSLNEGSAMLNINYVANQIEADLKLKKSSKK